MYGYWSCYHCIQLSTFGKCSSIWGLAGPGPVPKRTERRAEYFLGRMPACGSEEMLSEKRNRHSFYPHAQLLSCIEASYVSASGQKFEAWESAYGVARLLCLFLWAVVRGSLPNTEPWIWAFLGVAAWLSFREALCYGNSITLFTRHWVIMHSKFTQRLGISNMVLRIKKKHCFLFPLTIAWLTSYNIIVHRIPPSGKSLYCYY